MLSVVIYFSFFRNDFIYEEMSLKCAKMRKGATV